MTPLHSESTRRDAQLELEALSVDMGIARYRKTLAEEGDVSTSPGLQLMKASLDPMAAAVRAWVATCEEGVPAKSASLYYFVAQMDPVSVAWLTAQTAFHHLAGAAILSTTASGLALNLESSLNLETIQKEAPALHAKMLKRMKTMDSEKNRALFIRKGTQLVDVKVVQWDQTTRIRLGTLLLQMFAESTGLITLETVALHGGRTTVSLRATESCRRWLEEAHARCELLNPIRMPMICRPRDWTSPFNGGYLTPKMRQPIIKTRNRGYLSTLKEWEMPQVYAAVNALQDTAWAINTPVYEVVKALWEASSDAAGLPSREALPIPTKNWNDGVDKPDPEVLHAWKVDAAKVYEGNAKMASKRLQLVQKLWVAEQMLTRGNRFHYVYNMDWRGRLYPVGASLNPQGDDVAKAMLTFAHGSRLGDDGAYWLAIHGANSFGVDKVSFEERVEWVQAHEVMIVNCAYDPFVYTDWQQADAPFTFLAFCFEWSRLGLFEGDQRDFVSHLPVAFDGACNGLQNFSAMLRDEVGGKATGLIPSEKPSDIYSEVAKAAQALIDQMAGEGHEVAPRWVGKMTRKLAKRNTMTVPYGVTRRGMRDQLFQELTESSGTQRAEDADFLAGVNFEAIGHVVVAARNAMDWLREAAKVAASNKLPVRWTSPVGLLILQDYRVDEGEKVDFTVLGRRFQLTLNKTGDALNTRKQSLGISPNFVHSLDAAHLMRTVLFCVQDGMRDFAMIHDSYGCHAGKASLLRDNLRQAFVDQYREDVLGKFREELVQQLPENLVRELPPLPQYGSLDLEQVRQSEYFFA